MLGTHHSSEEKETRSSARATPRPTVKAGSLPKYSNKGTRALYIIFTGLGPRNRALFIGTSSSWKFWTIHWVQQIRLVWKPTSSKGSNDGDQAQSIRLCSTVRNGLYCQRYVSSVCREHDDSHSVVIGLAFMEDRIVSQPCGKLTLGGLQKKTGFGRKNTVGHPFISCVSVMVTL